VPDAGVPDSVPVPSPLSTNVTPEGSEPVTLSAGVGVPTVVTVKLPVDPTVKVVLLPEVMATPRSIVSVKDWVVDPAELVAVKVMG
jgi:hypothetical protein